ncbi:RNA polymerase sporulation sigma factor SigK [Serpentinicella sp. ANB-PHB4]|uniref:RNA polymerase sporulation sigma factor SigK n=1 Tax=Serpentinicella sp. ANB-PHB4 TaxID=3074076 RepID=UPI002864DD12|nr:RNA polymerase sporulation sigma factor SigK [Serpentinicella sp. ANB-PHB4]MDR5658113.1 RNA polymerase sporulation sigma factor SigK [Serpentinicella sp. ANB-PHB4]
MLGVLVGLLPAITNPIVLAVSYISSNTSFPKPLSKEEEEKYLALFEQGDEDARNILVERNLRLVAHIVKKYGNVGFDVDDLISIGTIGLIKGITTFNREKGTRLATYAARCIENEILMTIRSSKKIKTEVSLQEPIGIDREGNEISLIDVLGTDTDEVINEVELKLQVKKLYEKMKSILKKREQIVLEMRYGLCQKSSKTQREIAKTLGISRSYVSRIEKRAIKKLYQALEANKD